MKVTKQQLKHVIQEEIKAVLTDMKGQLSEQYDTNPLETDRQRETRVNLFYDLLKRLLGDPPQPEEKKPMYTGTPEDTTAMMRKTQHGGRVMSPEQAKEEAPRGWFANLFREHSEQNIVQQEYQKMLQESTEKKKSNKT